MVPEAPPSIVPQLSIVAALSMHAALAGLAPGLDAAVKWPNDVWIGGRKACGILCTMSCIGDKTEHAVLGIGLNVNVTQAELPAELQERTTSLRIALGRSFDRCGVLAAFLNGKSYQEIAEMLGRHVKSIDNALQRVKRKLTKMLEETE